MINCFPELYEDELLYSAVSRYKRQCGLINKEAISKDFIFKSNKIFPAFFPLRLKKISEILPATSKITAEQLLYNHTMYPFYTKLLPQESKDEIKDSMLNKDDVNIALKLGTSNIIKQSSYLRYCSKCIKEDIETLGESYWRREHQAAGVLFCSKHEIKLQESDVICSSINREYVCLDDVEIRNKYIADNKYMECNLKYINLMKDMVNSDFEGLNLIDIKKFYINKFYDIGLTTKSGKIHIKELACKINEFYGQEYLKLMCSAFDSFENNWIMNFFSENNSKPVLRHLLLLQFLNCSIKDMFEFVEDRYYSVEYKEYIPKLDLEERKEKWLEIIRQNPNKSRNQLIEINPKVYSYVFKYDRGWYERVTPKNKNKKEIISDWKNKDMELLKRVKEKVKEILDKEDKPIRICNSSIRRELGLSQGRFNRKLVKTLRYINEVTETNEEYWIRKIKWAIEELQKEEIPVTVYKVQKKSGFGETIPKSKKKFIESIVYEYNI